MLVSLSNVTGGHGLLASDLARDNSALSTSVHADLVIALGENVVVDENVDLIRFYFDIRDTLQQVLMRGLTALVRVEFEVAFALAPLDEVDVVAEARVGPYDGAQGCRSVITVRDVRRIMNTLENAIRSSISGLRPRLADEFERSQSSRLFDILRIIDGDVEVKSG
jgi:hypothetical protein